MLLGLLAIPLSDNARNPFMRGILLAAAVMAFWLWAGFALAVKRLHDLDKPGWHYVCVPLLATLYLVFARGSDGPNRYGYPP